MTGKRFHYDSALEKIYDYDTCEDGIAESLDCFDACELLNELHEENEKLHDEIFRLRTELAYDRTEKEEHSDSVYDFKKKLEKW